jgi:hypothetical protein
VARSAQAAAAARDFAVATGGASLRERRSVRDRIRVSTDSGAGLVEVTANGRSVRDALVLADGVALQAAASARELVLGEAGGGRLVVGDFEDGLGYWSLVSLFNAPPRSEGVTTAVAHDGRASLEAACRGVVGCGPSTRIYHPFRAGVTYTATLWVRTRPVGFPLCAVFGSGPDDVVTTTTSRGGAGWRRLVIDWTPRRNASLAAVGVQTRARGQSRLWVDGALVFDPSFARAGARRVARPAQEAKILASVRPVVVSPARSTGTVSDSVVGWALAGATIGLLAAVVAVLLGWLANRRRED